MASQVLANRNLAFKVGWIALLFISVAATLGHIILMFAALNMATAFIGLAAYTSYASVVLYLPFRRGESWAWYTSWILVIGFAAPILFTRESFAVWYLGAAVVMAVALVLTRPAFFPNRSAVD